MAEEPQEQAVESAVRGTVIRVPPGTPGASPGGIVPPPEHRFQPGVSGNPGGRPRGASVVGPMLRELARNPDEDGYGAEAVAIAARLIEAAKAGDAKAVQAVLGIMDRTDGPLVKERHVTGDTVKRVILEKPPDATAP